MRPRRDLTDEERELASQRTFSTFDGGHAYRERDIDSLVQMYTTDAISVPSGHSALVGHDAIAAWYEQRTGDFDMNVVSDVDSVDVVGDLAVLVGRFRVTRAPEDGVAGLDHGGRWLAVLKREGGVWRLWRDMDAPSPDADSYYQRLPRGQ